MSYLRFYQINDMTTEHLERKPNNVHACSGARVHFHQTMRRVEVQVEVDINYRLF